MQTRVLAVLFLSMFAAMLGIGLVSPLLPVFADEMGATGIWLGLIWSGFSISSAVLTPIVGRLSDRKGRKGFIMVGLAVFMVAAVGYALSTSYYELVLFRVISGIGAAMVVPVAMAYMGDISPDGQEGRYMGLFNTAMWSGFGAGPLIGGVLKDYTGMDSTFYGMLGMSAVALVVVLLLLPDRKAEPLREDDPAVGVPYGVIMQNDVMRGLMTYQVVWALGSGSIIAFVSIYMKDNFGSSTSAIGLAIGARVLLAAVLQTPFGRLADRFNRISLVTIGGLASAVGTFAVPFTQSYAQLLLLFVIVGLWENLASPALSAITVDEGRAYGMGSVMGVFNTAMPVGILVGSVVAGGITDWLGVDFVFLYAGLAALAGLSLFLLFTRRASRQRQALVGVSYQEVGD